MIMTMLFQRARRLQALLRIAVVILPALSAFGQPGNSPEELIRVGQGALAHNDWRGAAQAFQRAVDLNPSSVSAHEGLGVALLQGLNSGAVRQSLDTDTAERAESHLKQAATLSPSAPRPLVELADLEVLLAAHAPDEESRAKHFEEAQGALKQVIALEPSKPEPSVRLANIERDQFTPVLEQAKARYPKLAGPIPNAAERKDLQVRFLPLIEDAIQNAQRASEMNASAQRPLLLLAKLSRERALLRDTQEQYDTDMQKAADWQRQFMAVGGHVQ
jgi:tetratricopeptide (TPR) repeat protein